MTVSWLILSTVILEWVKLFTSIRNSSLYCFQKSKVLCIFIFHNIFSTKFQNKRDILLVQIVLYQTTLLSRRCNHLNLNRFVPRSNEKDARNANWIFPVVMLVRNRHPFIPEQKMKLECNTLLPAIQFWTIQFLLISSHGLTKIKYLISLFIQAEKTG